MTLAGGSFSSAATLRLGEVARRRSPVAWAVEAVCTAWPGLSADIVEAWPLGQLDNALVALRQAHFGQAWQCEPKCDACGETFELELEPAEMGFGLPANWQPGLIEPSEVQLGGELHTVRPLIVHDLLVLERTPDEAAARAYLCEALGVADAVLDTALEAAAECDPLTNIWIGTTCPECEAEQNLLFDPARFLAQDMANRATGLLDEVATIAHAYHWAEADILAMPADRRRFYLSRIAA